MFGSHGYQQVSSDITGKGVSLKNLKTVVHRIIVVYMELLLVLPPWKKANYKLTLCDAYIFRRSVSSPCHSDFFATDYAECTASVYTSSIRALVEMAHLVLG